MISFMYSRARVSIKNENQSLNCILTSCLSTHKTCISTEEAMFSHSVIQLGDSCHLVYF